MGKYNLVQKFQEQKMRIDLAVPYTEKDAAKSKGARWDSEKKVWFIVDVEDLTSFMRWVKNPNHTKPSNPPAQAKKPVFRRSEDIFMTKKQRKQERLLQKLHNQNIKAGMYKEKKEDKKPLPDGLATLFRRAPAPVKKDNHKPATTGPAVVVPTCNCTTPPWEDCEHTEALANAAMHEMLDTVL